MYHISNSGMCISNQCNNVNSHLAILSDERYTQVVSTKLNSNKMPSQIYIYSVNVIGYNQALVYC